MTMKKEVKIMDKLQVRELLMSVSCGTRNP